MGISGAFSYSMASRLRPLYSCHHQASHLGQTSKPPGASLALLSFRRDWGYLRLFPGNKYLKGVERIIHFGRICVEIDISKGLPDQINLKVGNFHWTQPLDYENTAFRCRHCHQMGHLQNACATFLGKKKKNKGKSKSKRWKPCHRPPMDDLDSPGSDEEEIEAKEENTENAKESPMAGTEDPSTPPILQKHSHETSSSDSDKESPPSAQNILQLVPV